MSLNETVVVAGVYLLFQGQQLVYVGRSTNVYKRIAQHRQNGRTFDYAAVINLPEADTAWIERSLIDAFDQRKEREKKPDPEPRPVVLRTLSMPHPEKPVPDIMTATKAWILLARARQYPISMSDYLAAIECGTIPTVLGRPAGRLHRPRRLVLRVDVLEWLKAELTRHGFDVQKIAI